MFIRFNPTRSQMFPTPTARLRFRNWSPDDLPDLIEMNADPEVMRYFPAVLQEAENKNFLERLRKRYEEDGYTYYATERLDTGECIGFIGLARQTYEAAFTPCVDIGWRLKRSAWGQGFATEGAKRCLEFANERLGVKEVYAVAVEQNLPSINVMRKIGMKYDHHFFHPALKDFPELEKCAVYRYQW